MTFDLKHEIAFVTAAYLAINTESPPAVTPDEARHSPEGHREVRNEPATGQAGGDTNVVQFRKGEA